METILFAATAALSLVGTSVAGQSETVVRLETKTGVLEGTLLLPDAPNGIPVALIIAGSGPTDRDGNNPAMVNNSLKMLARELSRHGVASLRYDKRGIGKSQAAGVSEQDATLLAEANQNAEKRIIEGMNHVFNQSEADRMKNIQTYNQPDLPVVPELVEAVVEFIAEDEAADGMMN